MKGFLALPVTGYNNDTCLNYISFEILLSVQVLLRRFQISFDTSLDGVRDMLNSKQMTDAGPLDLIDDDNSDEEGLDFGGRGYGLPGTSHKNARPLVRTKCLQICPTGRSWAAATCEGVLLFSMDDDLVFDPTDLDVDVTPEVTLSYAMLYWITSISLNQN